MTIAPYREDTSAVGLPGNLSPVGLALPEGLTFHEWEHVGDTLKTIRDSALRWWWGDWLNYGERHYGERYAQAVEATDYTRESLHVAAFVCRQVEPLRRRKGLSFSHHQEVASLSSEDQTMWLADAETNRWGHKVLREMIAQTKRPAAPLPDRTREIDTDTGEVFGGGDWSRDDSPPTHDYPEPAPTPLFSAVADALMADGSYRDNVILEQYHATTQRLLGACSTGRDIMRHVAPDEMARLLTEEDGKSYRHVAELAEWFRQVHEARGAILNIRRIK